MAPPNSLRLHPAFTPPATGGSPSERSKLRSLQRPLLTLAITGLAWFACFRLATSFGPVFGLPVMMASCRSLFIAASAWTSIRLLQVGQYVFFPAQTAAEAEQLRLQRTRYQLIGKLLGVCIVVAAAVMIGYQFEAVRKLGLSILASAGLLGIILGFAGQKSLGGLIAGVQVMVTQPIRLGDAVVIDDEYGTIEEISLTYAVVRFWDERRYVVPISRFLQQPFENWTRGSAEVCASVILYVDFTAPIDKLREELDRIVANHPCWDGRYAQLIVRDMTERAVVLRALVSGKNADDVFVLRWDVREEMVRCLQQLEGGRYLPRMRFGGASELEALRPSSTAESSAALSSSTPPPPSYGRRPPGMRPS